MTRFKRATIKVLAMVGALSVFGGFFINSVKTGVDGTAVAESYIKQVDAAIKTNQEKFYDSNVVYKLPETVAESDNVSVIVSMNTDSVMDVYNKADTTKKVSEYINTREARKVVSRVEKERNKLIKQLNKSGVSYTMGEEYDTILSGFEITVKAKDFEKVHNLFASQATLIIGETYNPAETQIVTNDVDVYETGIFDSSKSEYQGDGVVVAVLDTGLDYTHSAFSVENFTTSKEAFTLRSVSEDVGDTVAASYTPGLTGEDVYVNKKVPYAYDYADKDPDVLPINSEHGTHVAGIIAGNDDTITGVAPNAQLAIMKVFSDATTGAKDSWILSALEDCVTLGVDVINMSLGSGCGFSREVDKDNTNLIYDSIREAGISLITAAGNDYNATHASEKNGSLGLTSNPDSGVVGAPSTYEGSLSVASVDGVKTPYLLYNDDIIYFTEAATSAAKTKDFVSDILSTLGDDVTSHDFEYVTIPGIGRSSDYPEEDDFYAGKIVLVKRGTTTFEDKVRVALKEKGAAGIIIYNNVSGDISMSVGADVGAVCSISQDEGEMLAAKETGILKISKSQVAGPFMSDFSSWGPTSDLKIKPEITAHGGEILSAVPGQDYDRLSGTSMAAPNQAGAAALIRQYVKYSGVFGTNITNQEITALVNQLMMSTTDIVYNKNGLPYAVRKQGAGLVNIGKATSSASYITTFDEDGNVMDKTKLELGDDKERTGVYEMTFAVNNVSDKTVTYKVDSLVMTEGVSKTYTSHGDTTVTQDGYLLEGTTTTVVGEDGNTVTVEAGKTKTVTVKIVLSDKDKQYIEDSFAYGMYVEGFITLEGIKGTTVDMSVPMLAFYGDWTEAPIFDEEYYDTHKDEINAGLDPEDKLMADAYPTKIIGRLYDDYIAYLGSYAFTQDPAATQIAADKDHIAISNQENGTSSAVNALETIWAGLLRNVKEANISIVEDSTGKEIFNRTEYNLRKSSSSGNTMYYTAIDVEFSALEKNLKNNTKYTVTVTTYIDYGTHEDQQNVRNVFEFPMYIDFEAPVVTNVTYRTEYDKTTKETKLFADMDIYDNHYAMGLQLGQIIPIDPSEGYYFSMNTFGKYVTPVYSSFNSTSRVTVELTEYVSQIKESAGIKYNEDGSFEVDYNNNSFIATCYDYAHNVATYEIRLPDEILSMYFTEDTITLNPNETLDLSTVLNIYPSQSWLQVLDFTTSDSDIVDVVNQTLIAKQSGNAIITAVGYDGDGNEVSTSVEVKVLGPEDEGYVGGYTIPEVNQFTITSYTTNKAYYGLSSEEREIGYTGGTYDFAGNYALSMFPSESVTLQYKLDSYFPDRTTLAYSSGNAKIATVSEDGTIVAQAEGNTIITATVMFDGKPTFYSGRVSISVKDPFTTNSIYLMSYKGLGGTVEIPDDRGITTIYAYAFSNYEYVPKDLENGDVITDEDPLNTKPVYIGENTITKVIIPEGVEVIEEYAFAGLTALEEVVLPTTLNKIGVGAFLGCEKLKKINLENVKFINERAFSGCALEEVEVSSVVAIGNYAFQDCNLNYIELPESSQSLGIGAFYNNEYLTSVEFRASKIKIGSFAFYGCVKLLHVDINAAVIASYAFANCKELETVNFGKDVAVIGEYAFAGTKVSAFTMDYRNNILTLEADGAIVCKGEELILVAPGYGGDAQNTVTTDATSIGTGAFAGNSKIFTVYAQNANSVGAYAFADCTNLTKIVLNNVREIGDYAFANCEKLEATPDLSDVTTIGDYAFYYTPITSVEIAENTTIGNYAFGLCVSLESVTLGDNVTVGEGAFYCPLYDFSYNDTDGIDLNYYSVYDYEVKDEEGNVVATYSYYRYNIEAGSLSSLTSVTIGDNVVIGNYAFRDCARLKTLVMGAGTVIGDMAFYNAAALTLDEDALSEVKSIGAYAFSGVNLQDFWIEDSTLMYAYEREYVDGEEVLVDYVYTYYAPKLEKVNLTAATYVGEGAFAYNTALNAVEFGNGITEVAAYAFMNCSALTEVNLPEQITSVGEYAFSGTGLRTVDLSDVDTVGDYAFAATALEEVTLKENVRIADGAFAYCYDLAKVNNLEYANTIGAYAFTGTALTELTLTNVTYVGDYAFAQSAVEKVAFGDKLTALGENPFFACKIESFGKEVEESFGDKVIPGFAETYDVSETVKVIGGVLYQVVPNGLELVSYPYASTLTSYAVEEGTVRISARAFAGTVLENVTLPSTLKALGDKAFYECRNLSVVIFKSYYAPILEEEYDVYYLTYENLPFTGVMDGYEGLGIAPYYMWNITSSFSNFYFGANFVDYIGHISENLVMVKPANGQNYDTFILSQYFNTVVEGSTAATDNTLNVIALIAAIPKNITLADEAAIVAARTAYDKIPSLEQQALVSNYAELQAAESTLQYLKLRDQDKQDDTPIDPIDSESGFATFLKNNFVSLLAIVIILGLIAYVVVTQLRNKKNNNEK